MADKQVTAASFRDVLGKFLHIADHDYKGHVHDNVLNIFNDLDEDDQKLFLRGVVHIHSVVVGNVDALPKRDVKPKPVVSTRELEPSEIDDDDEEVVDYINTRQKNAIKVWMVKTLTIFICMFVFIVAIVAMVTGNGFTIPFFETFSKISGKIFGFSG